MAAVALDPEARARLEEEILADLEAERQLRLDALTRVQERSARRGGTEESGDHNAEVNRLREELRARFHREHGYKRYVDGTGREVWLTPEEYAWRMSRRRSRRRHPLYSTSLGRRRQWVLYGLVAVLAVVLGLVLAR